VIEKRGSPVQSKDCCNGQWGDSWPHPAERDAVRGGNRDERSGGIDADSTTDELLPAPAVEPVVAKAADDPVVGDEPRTYWWTPGYGGSVPGWLLVEEPCGISMSGRSSESSTTPTWYGVIGYGRLWYMARAGDPASKAQAPLASSAGGDSYLRHAHRGAG
jgi:hypothetical protein